MIEILETPYGSFKISDTRSPSGDQVAHARPCGKGFTINNKTYTGSVTLHRRSYGGDERLYCSVRGGYNAELTDSAQSKLEVVFAPVFEALPPLTHAEKLDKVINSARRSARSKLEYEVLGTATSAVRDAGMSQYNRANGGDVLTDPEEAKVAAAVLAEVKAWLAEQGV
jgi:hypothetical protein